MPADPIVVARAAYQAYVEKDRAAIEALITEDFHFTSPLDNRIDRATYFERCWPISETMEAFEFVRMIADGPRVFAVYEGRSTSGQALPQLRDRDRAWGPDHRRGSLLRLGCARTRRRTVASSIPQPRSQALAKL